MKLEETGFLRSFSVYLLENLNYLIKTEDN